MGFRSERLVIAGVGLIGGSFALALREAGCVGSIVGIGRSAASLQAALERKVIDVAATDWAEALRGADFVLLAAPVAQTGPLAAALAAHLPKDAVVTDAGSTKGDVAAAFRAHLPAAIARAVPGHPIAGAEKSGVQAAGSALYRGRRVVLTPLPENDAAAVARVRAAWQACGAAVSDMAPDTHDRVFAAVSHLPHLLAFALVEDLAQRPDAELLFAFAASGFRDFTRIAGSQPEMWRDICVANRAALLAELDAYQAQLAALRAMLAAGDGAALEAVFADARRARNAWADNQHKG